MASGERSYGPLDETRPARALAYGVLALSFAACAAVQLWFVMVDQPIGYDEGYIGALALRLLDRNMLPGVDAVGQRGPVLYWAATLAQLAFGTHHWWGFRVLGGLATSLVVLALWVLGRWARRPVAAAIAATFYAYTALHAYTPGAGLSIGGEQLASPLLCWGTVLTALALVENRPGRRHAYGFAAGVLVGLAGWCKITLLVMVGPLALWLLADSLRDSQRGLRAHAQAVLPIACGWLLPSAAIVLVYVAAGAFDAFVYRFFVYNSSVYMGPYAAAPLLPAIGNWFVSDPWTAYTALGAFLAFVLHVGFRAGMHHGGGVRAAFASIDVATVVLLNALLTFATGAVQMRFWPHHFVTALPWAGLVLGFALEWASTRLYSQLRAFLGVAVVLAAAVTLFETIGRDLVQREAERAARAWMPASNDALCGAIQRYSRPHEYVFVWGFEGDLYVSCRRKPASRFVYTTLVAGIVPPFWTQVKPERVARGAVQELIQDLRETRPPLIVDPIDWTGRVPMKSVPELKTLLKRRYCEVKEVSGRSGRRARLYVRRDRGQCGKAVASSE